MRVCSSLSHIMIGLYHDTLYWFEFSLYTWTE